MKSKTDRIVVGVVTMPLWLARRAARVAGLTFREWLERENAERVPSLPRRKRAA